MIGYLMSIDYWMGMPFNSAPFGLAYPASPDFPVFELQRASIRRVPYGSWEVQALEVRDGELADLQPSIDRLLVCSDRLKIELDDAKSPNDHLEWLPISMRSPDGGVFDYWLLLFPDPQPISDSDLSSSGVPFTPTPDFGRMAGRAIFRLTGLTSFYVRSDVRDRLTRAEVDLGIDWVRPSWAGAQPS